MFKYLFHQVINMAKPIRTTPTLYGEDANRFIKKMIHKEKRPLTNLDKEMIVGVVLIGFAMLIT